VRDERSTTTNTGSF